MSTANQYNLTLKLSALPDLECHVMRFRGKAALNDLYSIDVTALAWAADAARLGAGDLFAGEASFGVRDGSARAGEAPAGAASAWDAVWHGVVTGFRMTGSAGDWAILEITVGPALSRLEGQIQSRIHLDGSSLDAVRDSLVFGGIPSDRFRFDLDQSAYPKRDFVFQHEEDLWLFTRRLLEREGVGLRFDQAGSGDVAVFTSGNSRFPQLTDGDSELKARAVEVSGLGSGDGSPELHFMSSESRVPKAKVLLKDYNWENPNRPLTARLDVAPYGRGEIYLYGENFDTEAEGLRLAGIRREEELWAAETFRASARIPGIMPGLTLEVSRAGNPAFNGRYLVTGTAMRGSQAARVASGLGVDPAAAGPEAGAELEEIVHDVTMTRLDVPYRPRRVTPRPKAAGQVTAWIDGEGSGDTPEIDGYGRYKVLFPQDLSGRANGKASSWIRMAQPYVGAGYGQNFPLTPGTEVLVSFVDGNPDRPVITGAVANAETGNIVNSAVPNVSGLGTKGGGSLIFSNTPGKQRAALSGGSDRGHFAIAAGSPTTAALTADIASTTATASINTDIFTSTNTVGHCFAINASDTIVRKTALVMASLREAAEGAAAAAYLRTVEDPTMPPELANNIAVMVDYCISPLQPIISQIVTKATAPEPDPRLPDTNLLSLVSDTKGSSATWYSRAPYSLGTMSVWLTGFLMLMKSARDVMTSSLKVDQQDKANKEDTKSSGTQKKYSMGLAMTSTIPAVLVDILVLFKLMGALSDAKKGQNAQGILVQSKDAYVDVLSETWAGVGAKSGPVIIESINALASDDMRSPDCLALSGSGAAACLADERGGPVPADITSGNGVLLHSPLVRTLCDDLSLTATKRVAVKTPGAVTIQTGPNQKATVPSVTNITGIQNRVVKMSGPVVESGVEISAAAPDSDIVIRTVNGGSIIVAAGTGSGADWSAAPTLSLEESKALLQQGNNVGLLMQASSAELKVGANAKLSISAGAAKLTQSAGNELSIAQAEAKLSSQTAASVAGGPAKLELSAAGAKIDAGPGMVQVTGMMIKLG
ncbi:MAG: type VI secretion system tip protein VgrG [Deltaproteobacteria bacterium]|jgi:type VI secretion system VgrG family protein|nr:type VI secretion system tip protein VgrG [Deltaproteobacteria bacterium]